MILLSMLSKCYSSVLRLFGICILVVYLISCDASKSSAKRINIYATRDTLPTLFAALDLYQTKNESYVWFQRIGTIDTAHLPAHAHLIAPPGIPWEIMPNQQSGEIARVIAQRVRYLNLLYPSAHFNLYVDDYWWSLALTIFVAERIPEDRFNVIMITGGGNSLDFGIYYNRPDSVGNWDLKQKELKEQIERLNEGDFELLREIENKRDYKYEYVYPFAQRENVEYWMQFPESVSITDLFLKSEFAKAHLIKKDPNKMFDLLSAEDRILFLKAIGARKEELDEQYFNHKDNKPYLIISGTIPYHGNLGQEAFRQLIGRLMDRYQEEYHIIYKPHPITRPEDLELLNNLLNSYNVKILPQTIPIEPLFWIYPNLKVGGFDSSLFLTLDREKVLFIIAPQKEWLSSAVRYLFEVGIYKDVELVWYE